MNALEESDKTFRLFVEAYGLAWAPRQLKPRVATGGKPLAADRAGIEFIPANVSGPGVRLEKGK